jgi:3'(2'), 5'-bisphosphate nucleotidase
MDYKKVLDSIITISQKAGDKILDIYNSQDIDINIEVKKDLSPLTIADKASNDIIINELKSLTPNIPILSEEEKNVEFKDRKNWSEFWLVDPLDGTKEFINRNGEFTVNIALIKDNRPTMGVVYAPVLDTTWYGLENFGSFIINMNKNPEKIHLNKIKRDITKIVSSRSHANNPKLKEYMKQFKKYELIKMGSSIKMCLVADGTADCYPRFGPTMEWDTGAAHAVVKYAGGNIYNIETNKELVYNKENLLNPGFIVQ